MILREAKVLPHSGISRRVAPMLDKPTSLVIVYSMKELGE